MLAAGVVVLAATFVLFVSAVGRYRQLAGQFLQSPAPTIDAILVLTGGRDRIDEGVRLFAEGKSRRMLISGVHPNATRADVFRTWPTIPLLFECCIDLGYKAMDTIGNAAEARDWVATWGFRSVLVVTSAAHMPRSLVELAREMPDVTFEAHPVPIHLAHRPAWWANRHTAATLTVEYVKTLNAIGRLAWSRLGATRGAVDRHEGPRAATAVAKDPR